MVLDERDERIQALTLAPFKQRQRHEQLGLLHLLAGGGQLLHVCQLVDGTHIVVAFIHESCPVEISLGSSIQHGRLGTGQHRQAHADGQ